MPAFVFPRDLVHGIKSQWKPVSSTGYELPEDRVLVELLEICFHASLRTSEGRPVQCDVAYVPASCIPEGTLRLGRSVPLSDAELVRLSPVTQHRQTVIGCDESEGRLQVWGFFELGHAWVQHSAGDPPGVSLQPEDDPPECLTISIDGPGALTISQGGVCLVRLRSGRHVQPGESPLRNLETPLGQFFSRSIDDLLHLPRFAHLVESIERYPGTPSLLSTYTKTIQAILERVHERRHGGSIVIVRGPLGGEFAHVTYTVADHGGLADDVMAYHALDCTLRRSELAAEGPSELPRLRAERSLQQTSRSLIRGIGQISLLAAVDGAVLLDELLSIRGFGVRFPVMLPPNATVTDARSGVVHPCENWGLRHQSVFSLCQTCEQALGFVVSQDGAVSAIKAEEGRLYYWNGILD